MGRAIETKLSTFELKKHVLGYVWHVFNLGAEDALSMLNSSEKEETEDPLNIGSVYHRIHKSAVAIQNSPQKDQRFRKNIDKLNMEENHIQGLHIILDCPTRWN
jgi:chitinase